MLCKVHQLSLVDRSNRVMPLVLILIGLKGEATFYLVQPDATHLFNSKDACEQGQEICCSLAGLMGTSDMSDNACWPEWNSSGSVSV